MRVSTRARTEIDALIFESESETFLSLVRLAEPASSRCQSGSVFGGCAHTGF